jgi:hypothetical protein
MTTRNTNITGQPTIQDLMVRFLASRSDAASAAVDTGEGEVEPHEVAAGFRVDPRAAWNDATTNHTTPAVPLPAEWAALVNQPATSFAVAMAAGDFPQRVRDLHPLLTKFNPAELRPTGSQQPVPGLNGLRAWIAKQSVSQPILAAGLARVLGDFDTTEKLLPADAANERAALLWHRGQCEEALTAWNAMPESPAVLFNRGMALLFLGKIADAKPLLTQAVVTIPETSGWNALARLYLAVADIHG